MNLKPGLRVIGNDATQQIVCDFQCDRFDLEKHCDLETRVRINQGHHNSYHSTAGPWFPISINFVSKMHHFSDNFEKQHDRETRVIIAHDSDTV